MLLFLNCIKYVISTTAYRMVILFRVTIIPKCTIIERNVQFRLIGTKNVGGSIFNSIFKPKQIISKKSVVENFEKTTKCRSTKQPTASQALITK